MGQRKRDLKAIIQTVNCAVDGRKVRKMPSARRVAAISSWLPLVLAALTLAGHLSSAALASSTGTDASKSMVVTLTTPWTNGKPKFGISGASFSPSPFFSQ